MQSSKEVTRIGGSENGAGDGGSSASPDKDFIRDAHEMDDKSKDGDEDMVLLFRISDSGADDGTEELCVLGSYLGEDGNVYKFFGCDFAQIKP